jgi:uncharacterized GH25 family protein
MLVMAALSVGFVTTLRAHDFWLEPDPYWVQPQTLTPLTLQVGHGPSRQRSPIRISRIARFEAVTPDGSKTDLRADLHPGGAVSDGELRFERPGTYVLVLATDTRAQSHLSAIRFNDYLVAEGLTAALEYRKQAHQMDIDGLESYSRVAKSIVHVGSSEEEPTGQVTRAVGLPLEIVPERNPYAEPRLARLPVRVIYEGQPLQGALVKLTNLAQDAQPVETQLTDSVGRATFAMPKEGRWLLNVIWTKPLSGSHETDFETVFSSLSFGFP